ncbi:hypothetical protein D9M70_521820 [compost metagenome]
MGVEAAGAVVVVMLVGRVGMPVALAEMPQLQARQALHGDARRAARGQYARQEALHVRADPVQQVDLADPAHVGRAQRVGVRRGTGRQQHFRGADAVLHRRGDQL